MTSASATTAEQDRIRALDAHIRALDAAGVRRTTFYPLVAESLRATLDQPRAIRRAKAFAHLLDSVELVVLPHELLAGSVLGMWPVADGLPSYAERRQEAFGVIADYLAGKRDGRISPGRAARARWALMARDHYDANVTYRDLQRLIRDTAERFDACSELTEAEIGRELEWHFSFDYGEDTRQLMRELPWAAANHLDLNYQRVVRLGLCGIRNEITARLADESGSEKQTFYQAALIAIDAAIRFARRYADRLDREAGGEAGQRQRELTEMAAVCRRVADRAPGTFREALQLLWLVHVAANIDGGSALSFARLDQYLHAFYRRDLDEGVLTRDDAFELLACMWLKVNEPHMRTVQSVCIGGTTPAGRCGMTDLTRLCLEVTRTVRRPYPNVAARISADCPDWYLEEIVETVKGGFGQPMILNDDVWVPNLTPLYGLTSARDYYNMGCVEIMVMGKVGQWQGAGAVCFPQLLNDVLREQRDAGEEFDTFGSLLHAYTSRIRDEVDRACTGPARGGRFTAQAGACDPFGSALLEGCIESGRDMYAGGCVCPSIHPVGTTGLGTAVDSLSAIRRFVFEQRRLGLAEMVDLLDSDFRGREDVRAMLERGTPCFGNDLPDVDAVAAAVFGTFCDAVHSHNQDGRGPFVTVFFSYTGHVSHGEAIGATANGRHAGDTLSNGIGPTQGRDQSGPTALMNSICRLDHSGVTGAYALNVKLTSLLLADRQGTEAVRDLIAAYLRRGGPQLQINVLNQADLRAAQEEPANHADLVVRVGGYSEYFVKLDRHLQDEIIRRSAHSLV